MNKIVKLSTALLCATATITVAAQADGRAPNARERAKLSNVLTANGYTSWKSIERDDGRWEVDDARHRSGRVYDLDIRGSRIIHRERD